MDNKIYNQISTLQTLLIVGCLLVFIPSSVVQSTQPTDASSTKKIEFDGHAMARDIIEVMPRSEGPVIETIEQIGERVGRGEQLFRVDPKSYQFVVDRLQARFDNLTRRFENVKKELKKQQKLLEKKLTTSNKVHSILVAYNIVRGNLEETKAELNAAKFELENTVIKSPIEGFISEINVDVGDMARRDGDPAMIIMKYDPIHIAIEVDPDQHRKIRERQLKGMGRATNITLKFTNGDIYQHKGTYVGSFLRVDKETGKVPLLLSFPNPDLLILPGQKARIVAEFEGFEE